MSTPDTVGVALNVGDDRPSCFRELAETVTRVAGAGRWEFAPFTPERAAQEPGDFYSDITRIRRLVRMTGSAVILRTAPPARR